ncbi:MAG: HEAT repeat domain-containing protein [Phycisphaeraceae bacterium]|nr:HEAT repeat domain-containing protein [Phycisphaeraceae bacterium]
MNNRVWMLSALFGLLCVGLVWRLSSSGDVRPDDLSDKRRRSLSEAEQKRLAELEKIDPLADSDTYVRTLDQLSPGSVRQTLRAMRTRPPEEKKNVYSAIYRKSQKPAVRKVAIVMLRQAGEPDGKLMIEAMRNDKASEVRIQAAAEIAKQNLWEGIPALIEGMRDEDPAIRTVSRDAFEKMFGVQTQFKPNASPAEREKIVRQIERAYPQYKKYHESAMQVKQRQKQQTKEKNK